MPNWKKVVVSGSNATLSSLNVTGPITGSDIQINDWGSVSASLASIEAGVATQTLQDVTDNGNTTTNNITITGSLITTGSDSFINGHRIGRGASNIDTNIVLGSGSLGSITSGNDNTVIGVGSNLFSTTSERNAFVGNQVFISGSFAQRSVGMGYQAMYNSSAANIYESVAIGWQSQYVGGGQGNVAVGAQTMNGGGGGVYNVAIGTYSMGDGPGVGNSNVGIGTDTLFSLTSGSDNIALGHGALAANEKGNYNIGFGYRALYRTGQDDNSGSNNIAIGRSAGTNMYSGSNNIFIGPAAGSSFNTVINNVVIGGFDGFASPLASQSGNIILATGNGTIRIFSTGSNGDIALGGHTNPQYKVDISGSLGVRGNTVLSGSLNVTGPITGSDVQINGWGNVSASLASIESGATSTTLQEVTDNGNTTTNSIEVAGINVSSSGIISTGNLTIGKELPFIVLSHTSSFGIQTGGGIAMRSDAYNTAPSGTVMGSISVADGSGGVRGGIHFSKDSNSSTNIDFYNSGTGVPKLIISSSTVETPLVFKTAQYTTGSDAYIDKWGSISSSLASISSGASTLTLQDVTDNGNTTTNSLYLTGVSPNNTLRIGPEGGTVSPTATSSVGLGLHGSQIYWSGSNIDGGAAAPAVQQKAVEQFQTDHNGLSIGNKLYIFNAGPVTTGSFHSVHCDYTLFNAGGTGGHVFNVRAGSIIAAIDDDYNISYTEYSTPMTSGSQDTDDVELIVQYVGGFLQCWIPANNGVYGTVKSRVTIM